MADAISNFESRISQLIRSGVCGGSDVGSGAEARAMAIKYIAAHEPNLHSEYLAEYNRQHASHKRFEGR